jgi:RNA polymerase sigma-70 factor, ECF subfamily
MPPMPAAPDDLTGLLQAWGRGDESALHAPIPLVECELNRIARRCLAGERHARRVSATALVNEAFLRLVGLRRMAWQDRAHFFAMSARLMRRVLVDLALTRRAGKRGAEPARVTIDEAADVLRHDDALTALAVLDERKSRIVELRFFGGLSAEEAAEALGISGKRGVGNRGPLITARTSTRRISADRRRSRGPSKASA